MVRKVSVWFGMGHCAMQCINTLVLLRSLRCLWLNTEGHQKKLYCYTDGRLKVDFANIIERRSNRSEMALY